MSNFDFFQEMLSFVTSAFLHFFLLYSQNVTFSLKCCLETFFILDANTNTTTIIYFKNIFFITNQLLLKWRSSTYSSFYLFPCQFHQMYIISKPWYTRAEPSVRWWSCWQEPITAIMESVSHRLQCQTLPYGCFLCMDTATVHIYLHTHFHIEFASWFIWLTDVVFFVLVLSRSHR